MFPGCRSAYALSPLDVGWGLLRSTLVTASHGVARRRLPRRTSFGVEDEGRRVPEARRDLILVVLGRCVEEATQDEWQRRGLAHLEHRGARRSRAASWT